MQAPRRASAGGVFSLGQFSLNGDHPGLEVKAGMRAGSRDTPLKLLDDR